MISLSNFFFNNIKKIFIFYIIISISLFHISYADDVDYTDNVDNTNETINNSTSETSINATKELNLNSRSCVVIDRLSNNILYGKNELNKVKMASTTKIMTSTLIIENCNLKDTVEISKKAAGTGGSRLGLKIGDKISVNDLLYGLMLCSGNDAAVALAEYCSGSVQEFANLMNAKTKELNLSNTHFESPHGLDSDNHYTTAYELALLSNYALKNDKFLNIVGTKSCTITINGNSKNLSNTNELLGFLNGVYGIKTGFTNGANRCLVTACKRGDLDIICVVLGADTKKFRTKDSINLIEYTFKNYTIKNLQDIVNNNFEEWKKTKLNNLYINKGTNQNIEIKIDKIKNKCQAIKKENLNNIDVNINCSNYLEAPVYSNSIIGSIEIYVNNTLIDSCKIYSVNNIEKKNILNYFFDFIKTIKNSDLY